MKSTMTSSTQFSLRWNNYLRHITYAFDSLRNQEDFVDVTLSCEGKKIRAHKVLLSACSTYFKEIFKDNPCHHPVIIFKNVKYEDLHAIIEFMYQGEVNVVHDSLPSFLHTAELLSVQGLTESTTPENQASLLTSETSNASECLNDGGSTIGSVMGATNFDGKEGQKMTIESNLNTSATLKASTSLEGKIDKIPTTSKGQNSNITLQNEMPMTKRRKCITSHETTSKCNNEMVQEDDHAHDSDELTFIPSSMKMELPEYIEVAESKAKSTQIIDEPDEFDELIGGDERNRISKAELLIEPGYRSELSDGGQDLNDETMQGSGDENKVIDALQDAELRFRCSICWKGFKHPMSLTLHKDLHTGKTKCPVCMRAFSRSYDMRTHLNRIHKITLSLDAKLNIQNL